MAKLSKEAAKRKAVRDKKAAMTPARRNKKAENQRIRRAAAKKHGKSWLNGKDYDHDDKRFESIKANRGNDGNGTKKEGKKTTRKTKHMAYKMKSPLNVGAKYTFKNLEGIRAPRFSAKKYMKAAPGTKFAAATSGEKSSFDIPSKITSTTGGSSNLDFSKGNIIGQYSKGKSKPSTTSKPSDGIMVRDANKNNAERVKNKQTSIKPKSSASTKAKPAAKPISSRDSGDRSGGYLKDTRNFSLGVDLSMPRSKMQTTVYNARSTDNNLIGGRLSRRGKIAARQVAKTGRVKERVGNRIEKIKGGQVRAGIRAGEKMARRDKGIDPGYFDSQKKLDAFEKSSKSPRATSRTSGAGNISSGSKMPSLRTPKSNQSVAKPSIKLNTSTQTSKTIPDSKIKKGAKKASGGRKVSSDTYKSLTGFSKMTSKPGSSGGMQRGMTRVDQTKKLTNLASGNQPRKDVKNMSSKNYLTKGIKPSYKK